MMMKMMSGRISNIIQGVKPALLMVMVQISFAWVNIFYKLAANDGMKVSVLIAYRLLFAAAFIIPVALCVERKSRPKLTWMTSGLAFLSGLLLCSMGQNLAAQSLVFTSPTFASAMTNIIPALTFVLAIFFRMERLGLNTMSGKAKVVGTLLSIGGAMLLTFYVGPEIKIWSTNVDLLHNGRLHDGQMATTHHSGSRHHALGVFMLICCCLTSASGVIVQAKIMQRYPCIYSASALTTFMGSIQAVVFGLCMERSNWSQWKLGWNIRLLTVSFSGVVASGVMLVFTFWCVQMRGPLFVSVFSPLLLVIVAVLASLLLQDQLHLGSVLGGIIIICGLYAVLWGKGRETKKFSKLMPSQSFSKSKLVEIKVDTISTENNNNDNLIIENDQNDIVVVLDGNGLSQNISQVDDITVEEDVPRQGGI